MAYFETTDNPEVLRLADCDSVSERMIRLRILDAMLTKNSSYSLTDIEDFTDDIVAIRTAKPGTFPTRAFNYLVSDEDEYTVVDADSGLRLTYDVDTQELKPIISRYEDAVEGLDNTLLEQLGPNGFTHVGYQIETSAPLGAGAYREHIAPGHVSRIGDFVATVVILDSSHPAVAAQL